MNWRPEDWDKIRDEKIEDKMPYLIDEAFEVGVDAMLETLRKSGLHLPGNVPTDNAEGLVRITLALRNVAQTIVIIPDEETG